MLPVLSLFANTGPLSPPRSWLTFVSRNFGRRRGIGMGGGWTGIRSRLDSFAILVAQHVVLAVRIPDETFKKSSLLQRALSCKKQFAWELFRSFLSSWPLFHPPTLFLHFFLNLALDQNQRHFRREITAANFRNTCVVVVNVVRYVRK